MSTQFLKTQHGTLAYDLQGSGPLVICVPSMGDLRQEYRFFTPLLTVAGYRVASLDVRGHGETSTNWPDYSVAGVGADIVALARHLGGPAVIYGTSMAAGAAVWAAVETPDLFSAIVLAGPFVSGGGDGLTKTVFTLMFSRPWGPALWRRYYGMLHPTRKPADLDEYSARLQANLQEPGRHEALIAMLRAPKTASGERLGRVSVPALVLMGSKDPDFKDPAAHAAQVAESVHGQVHILEGAGHYPHAEMPAETAGLLLPFLRRVHPAVEPVR